MMAMIPRTVISSTKLKPSCPRARGGVSLLMAPRYSNQCARRALEARTDFKSRIYTVYWRHRRPIGTLQGATSRNASVGPDGRQAHGDEQSSGGSVGHDEVSLMQLDDLEGDGKAESEASGFRGEERPHSLARGGRDPGAVIRDGDHDRVALASGSDPDVPLFPGGFPRVADEVLERPFEQVLVADERSGFAAALEADLAARPAAGLAGHDPGEHSIEVHGHEVQLLAADEVHEAADHRLEGLALFPDPARRVDGRGRRAGGLHEPRVAEDRAEAVAHLVDHARGQLSRPRHGLPVLHRILERLVPL